MRRNRPSHQRTALGFEQVAGLRRALDVGLQVRVEFRPGCEGPNARRG
jgi:hypothetical protein